MNYLGGASVAIVLVYFTHTLNLTAIGAVIPIVVILYITFRTSSARVEDADRHVAKVNELYLSTIETLAMAVDAKDQITHGNIRRVQVFAVELAKRLGVNDGQLKVIATAALLHDSKLATPEHILNKPGKLTPTEFEKMKLHADIGADLLSSIKFPYPVVPIVRHRHEHWNGEGYSAGISGTDIPLGARILSVVDCFDALTSDRPYRPKLSVEAAFRIIRQQRGTTHGPLVVDAFIKAYPDISPSAIRAGQDARSVTDVPDLMARDTLDASTSLRHIRMNATEAALLSACSGDIARATSAVAALETSALYLRQITPATVYAFFVYDSSSDVLKCAGTVGDNQGLLAGLTIKLGERVTGWVAANRRTSVNSDASLDLVRIAGCLVPPLRNSISTPLVEEEALVGVLTAYSGKDGAFDEGHQYSFEYVAVELLSRVSILSSSFSASVLSFPVLRR